VQRYTRDIDLLVEPSQLIKTYNLIKSIGFKYHATDCNDSAKGSLNYSRHLPEMLNSAGVVLEIHHRVTNPLHFRRCKLSQIILANKTSVHHSEKSFFIPRTEEMIIHLYYHSLSAKKPFIEPMLFLDIKSIYKKHKVDIKRLVNLATVSGLCKYYDTGNKIISDSNNEDKFSIQNVQLEDKSFKNIFKKALSINDRVSYYRQIDLNEISYRDILSYLYSKVLKNYGHR